MLGRRIPQVNCRGGRFRGDIQRKGGLPWAKLRKAKRWSVLGD
jgi:hypothetical protein